MNEENKTCTEQGKRGRKPAEPNVSPDLNELKELKKRLQKKQVLKDPVLKDHGFDKESGKHTSESLVCVSRTTTEAKLRLKVTPF